MRHLTHYSNQQSSSEALQIGLTALGVTLVIVTLGLLEANADGTGKEPDEFVLRVSDSSQVSLAETSLDQPRRSSRRRRSTRTTPSKSDTKPGKQPSKPDQAAEQGNESHSSEQPPASAFQDGEASSDSPSELSLFSGDQRNEEKGSGEVQDKDGGPFAEAVAEPLPLRAEVDPPLSIDPSVVGRPVDPPANGLRGPIGIGLNLDAENPNDSQPIDSQPIDAQPRPIDTQPIDTQPFDTQPFDVQPIDAQPVEARPEERLDQPVGRHPYDLRSAQHTKWLFSLLGIMPDPQREFAPLRELNASPIPEAVEAHLGAPQEIGSPVAHGAQEVTGGASVEDTVAATNRHNLERENDSTHFSSEAPRRRSTEFAPSTNEASLFAAKQPDQSAVEDARSLTLDEAAGPRYVLADEPRTSRRNRLRNEEEKRPAEGYVVSDSLRTPSEIAAPEAASVEIIAPKVVALPPRELEPGISRDVPVELSETVTFAIPPTLTSLVELEPPRANWTEDATGDVETLPDLSSQGERAPTNETLAASSIETVPGSSLDQLSWKGSQPTVQTDSVPRTMSVGRVSSPVMSSSGGSSVAAPDRAYEASASDSQNARVTLPSPQSELRLLARTSHPLRTASRIKRVSVANRLVCDAMQFAPYEVALIAKRAGQTNVTIWFDGQKKPQTYRVVVDGSIAEKPNVGPEYVKLQALLDELFPESLVTLNPGRERLVVLGEAKDRQEAIQIMSVIRSVRLIPVVDQLQVK